MEKFHDAQNSLVALLLNNIFNLMSTNVLYLSLISGIVATLIFLRRKKTGLNIHFGAFLIVLVLPIFYALEHLFFPGLINPDSKIEIYDLISWGWINFITIIVLIPVMQALSFWIGLVVKLLTKERKEEKIISADIRRLLLKRKHAKHYNPISYFKSKLLFLGLNEKRVPQYLDWIKACVSSLLITGCAGSGKTLFIALYLCQLMAPEKHFFWQRKNGSTIVAFDPKGDSFFLRVLTKIAKRFNLPVTFVELNLNKPIISLAEGLDAQSHAELHMIDGTFADKGTDADFHKQAEREELLLFTRFYDLSKNLDQNYKNFLDKYPDSHKSAPGFNRHIKALIELRLFSAKPGEGLNVKEVIESGGFLYIKGHVKNPLIKKAQRMLMARIIKHVETRDKKNSRHVCFSLEEAKHVVSEHVVTGIATLRDFNANFTFSCQSLTDSCQNDQNIPPEAIRESVLVNTRYKLAFETPDPELARYYSDLSGEITNHNTVKQYVRNAAFSEVDGERKSLVETQKNLIHANQFLALQPGEAVLFGNGLAQKVYFAPIKVSEDDIEPDPFTAKDYEQTGGKVIDEGSDKEGLI